MNMFPEALGGWGGAKNLEKQHWALWGIYIVCEFVCLIWPIRAYQSSFQTALK